MNELKTLQEENSKGINKKRHRVPTSVASIKNRKSRDANIELARAKDRIRRAIQAEERIIYTKSYTVRKKTDKEYMKYHSRKSLERYHKAKKDKEKYSRVRARGMVKKAIIDGKLIRPNSCTECHKSDVKIQAHHHDYTKPLDVKFLCIQCHVAEHRKERKAESDRKLKEAIKIVEKYKKLLKRSDKPNSILSNITKLKQELK